MIYDKDDKQICDELALVNSVSVSDQKVYKRSRSEELKREILEEKVSTRKLRRSETEKLVAESGRSGETKAEVVDKLSNEEFQRTIEAFIAKQVRFHKEEKLSILLPQPTHALIS